MKKIVFLTTLLLVLAGILPLVAQQNNPSAAEKEGSYALTISLERVFPYRKGYVVKYRKGMSGVVDAYLPLEWFEGTGKKGDLILMGSGTDWPHMTVFYKDGEFDHVRLYVRKERSHESWGNIPLHVNLDDKFESVEGIKLVF
ncbi:hypothetical protein [Treponema primitia]|uniref:hypothetical protein n=1 Tax=Treponema primitia TaxID=88058 RepID=UPI0002555308|nr:hypothetical protein [Treponema primitia]